MRSILLVRSAPLIVGGIENQVIYIAEGYSLGNIYNPILITSDKDSLFAQAFKARGFMVFQIPMSRVRILEGARALETIVRKHDVACLQSHRFRESLICRVVKMRHPNLYHMCRVHTHTDSSALPEWRKRSYHLIDRLSSNWVDLYLPISDIVSKELVERTGIEPTKIKVVRNGVPQVGTPDQVDEGSIALPTKVAMVANLMPGKGFDVLIDGLILLKKKGLVVNVRLIGGESDDSLQQGAKGYKNRLMAKAAQNGVLSQLEFYGYSQDIGLALRGYPVFVLPSFSEGLPNCILEAMSIKKLVVASNVGGIPEIIKDRVNGLLHAAQDPQAFANILEEIFTTPASTWAPVRNSGFRSWEEEFSLNKLVENLCKASLGNEGNVQ